MYYTTVGGDQSRFSGHFLSASGPIHNIVANTCTHVLSKNSCQENKGDILCRARIVLRLE